jgi:hypothetical protein
MAAGLGRETTALLSTLLALGIFALEHPIRRMVRKRGAPPAEPE